MPVGLLAAKHFPYKSSEPVSEWPVMVGGVGLVTGPRCGLQRAWQRAGHCSTSVQGGAGDDLEEGPARPRRGQEDEEEGRLEESVM